MDAREFTLAPNIYPLLLNVGHRPRRSANIEAPTLCPVLAYLRQGASGFQTLHLPVYPTQLLTPLKRSLTTQV